LERFLKGIIRSEYNFKHPEEIFLTANKKNIPGWRWLLGLVILLAACSPNLGNFNTPVFASPSADAEPILTVTPAATFAQDPPSIWLDEGVPAQLREKVPTNWSVASAKKNADLVFTPVSPASSVGNRLYQGTWVFCLVTSFYTVTDDISFDDFRAIWNGSKEDIRIQMTDDTRSALVAVFGEPLGQGIQIRNKRDLLAEKNDEESWAVVPFDELVPQWKVLSINGESPLDKNFEAYGYPLTVVMAIMQQSPVDQNVKNIISALPKTNRDSAKMTTVLLTGTTALARGTALQMEEFSALYPAEMILDVLLEPDFLHISNEVSFNPECPSGKPLRIGGRFCSRPEYFDLFKLIDPEFIELTGNHELDWGAEGFLYSLDLYQANQMLYYGGGRDAAEASQPLLIEHHGNKIALLGCNVMGPDTDLATATTPGSARCDMDKLEDQVQQLRKQGYLPIVTFQHFEVCDIAPQSSQKIDFARMASAGAVIVSGSQAHCPQAMVFINGAFVHYGLGNLFFDQMDDVTREEFLDRHVFYDGRYISTEILTAKLENSAQPRPMTDGERAAFLTKIFAAAQELK